MLPGLLQLINEVRANKQVAPLASLSSEDRLREDLGFDSMDLAELVVRIEERFSVDVFATGPVLSVGELAARLRTGETVRPSDGPAVRQ